MTPGQLAAAIRDVAAQAVAAGEAAGPVPAEIQVRPPAQPEHGQWTTAIALTLAPGPHARALAARLAARLSAVPGIERVDVAGPGFLNITLDGAALDEAVLGMAEMARSLAEAGPAAPGAGLRDHISGLDAGRVRFAHARACAVLRQAASHGVTRSVFAPELLSHAADHALLTALAACTAQYPDRAQQAQDRDDAEHPLRHLELLAGAFGSWYAATRTTPRGHDPVTDEHRTRLWLAEAARIVLADGLTRLGLTAPERI